MVGSSKTVVEDINKQKRLIIKVEKYGDKNLPWVRLCNVKVNLIQ